MNPKFPKPKSSNHRGNPQQAQKPTRALASGLGARQLAVVLISAVINEKRALDDALSVSASSRTFANMEPRDRAFARLIAATVLRRHGELTTVVQTFLDKPLPERRGRLMPILLSGAAQLIVLGTPPHAAISQAVDQCRLDRDAQRFDKLTNAVLRRVSEKGAAVLEKLDAALNVPPWLMRRWQATYGEQVAGEIAAASLREAPLDLSLKASGQLNIPDSLVLPTGSVRLTTHGRVEDLAGYHEGDWWVQDAAAALPARLLGDVKGLDVVDLCAAPGGKTAELAAAGAKVTSVDVSHTRLQRVGENLQRLNLKATLVEADGTAWSPGRMVDAVLLDAPCTATGTIRRHPDILHLKRESDIAALADLQRKLLDNAARLVRPGGMLVYCTCSLEPEEGVRQIEGFLTRHSEFTRSPVTSGESGIAAEWVTQDGDLRTLPTHLALEKPELSGMDGFFAARLIRKG